VVVKPAAGDTIVVYYPIGAATYQIAKFTSAPVWNKTTGELTLTDDAQVGYFTEGMNEFGSWNGKDNVGGMNGGVTWPANPTETKPLFADIGTSQLTSPKSLLAFNYFKDASNGGATVTNAWKEGDQWYYCEDDGYFYYMKVLTSGSQTKMLLESLYFDDNLPDTFLKASYKLAVTVEAIQAYKAAVSDGNNGGWNLKNPLAGNLQDLHGMMD